MRSFLRVVILLVITTAAMAADHADWTKNRSLFWPDTPISLNGSTLDGKGFTTFNFFSSLTAAGGKCMSSSNEKGRIVVTCAAPSKFFAKSAVVSGEFVGAGYLDVDTIVVDGSALSMDKRAAFFKRVLTP